MVPKSIKIGPQSCLGGVLGHLGPKKAPRALKKPNMKVLTFSWEPFWDPKSIKIGSKSDPKGNRFYDQFEDRFLERFGPNLAPSWPPKAPKMGPSWLPNRCRLVLI